MWPARAVGGAVEALLRHERLVDHAERRVVGRATEKKGLKFAVKLPLGEGTMVSVPVGPLPELLLPPQAESARVSEHAPDRSRALMRRCEDAIGENPPFGLWRINSDLTVCVTGYASEQKNEPITSCNLDRGR